MTDKKKSRIPARSNIGVRNPYPLANAILMREKVIQEPIPWEKISAEAAKGYLYKAFHVEYSRLFDPNPRFRSPLYRGVPRGDGSENPSSGAGKEFLFSRRTGGSPCVANVKRWWTLDGWKYPPSPPPATSSNCGAGPFGVDAMQGCAADCYFIAALTSVAWTQPSLLTGKPDGSNPPKHRYRFYKAPGVPALPLTSIARSLALDPTDTLVFARPVNRICVWPGLYEKAYAVFQKIPPPDTPDITKLDFGNATGALMEISGLSIDAVSVMDFSADDLFDFVNAKSNLSEPGPALVPMVAWTYFDGTGTPHGDTYTDDLIVANHSYSILGTGIVDDKPCIVLRNPYGISFADPVKPGIAEWNIPWAPGRHLSTSTPDDPPVHPANGNFAMEAETFIDYFEGIGFPV